MNFVKVEKQGNVGILTIDKPDTLNALNSEVLEDLKSAIDQAESDDEIFVVVLTGTGKAFVSGADIAEMSTKTPLQAKAYSSKGAKLFRRIELLEKPVICVLNGVAFGGGCELAMSCDIRLAGEKIKMGLPEVTLGITPGFSGTARLPRLIGVAKAKEWIFSGKIATAQEALSVGLVNAVYPHDTLMEEAMNLANKIASNSQSAIRLCKDLLNHTSEIDIDAAIDLEVNVEAVAFGSHDQLEGMAAFKEKRKPNFNV
ncbi:MAG: enoyl-CoA hydratase-related protein [Anaerofustis sp.]|jgi:enoyl-CoA hydratase